MIGTAIYCFRYSFSGNPDSNEISPLKSQDLDFVVELQFVNLQSVENQYNGLKTWTQFNISRQTWFQQGFLLQCALAILMLFEVRYDRRWLIHLSFILMLIWLIEGLYAVCFDFLTQVDDNIDAHDSSLPSNWEQSASIFALLCVQCALIPPCYYAIHRFT